MLYEICRSGSVVKHTKKERKKKEQNKEGEVNK
jgi:hypothetical protein